MLRIMRCECVVVPARGGPKGAGCYGVLSRKIVYIIYSRYPHAHDIYVQIIPLTLLPFFECGQDSSCAYRPLRMGGSSSPTSS